MNENESSKQAPDGPPFARTTGYLKAADLEGSPADIIRRLAGVALPLPNRWGDGVVVGAWKLKGERVKLLLAWPTAENPDQLFNEDGASFLPPSDNDELKHRRE